MKTSLNFDILSSITNYLQPLHLHSLMKARFANGSVAAPEQSNLANLWSSIFKNETWINKAMKIEYELSRPTVGILGKNFKLKRKHKKEFVLFVNDWGGDIPELQDDFFKSLKKYEPDKYRKNVIHFKRSNISLHIGDAITAKEEIEMDDPSIYFNSHGDEVSTFVSYYKEPKLIEIGQEDIGGVDGRKGKEAIHEVCCVKLRFGDGSPIYRELTAHTWATKLVPKRVMINGRTQIKSWREARPNEQGLSR